MPKTYIEKHGEKYWIREGCRYIPYRTWFNCVQRWPRLTKCIQQVGLASIAEAGCLLRDYRQGVNYSCEVWSHSGLDLVEWIRSAIKNRHTILGRN